MRTDPLERRTVTVLFSDLSGFTRLSEHRDPEEVQDIVEALFQRFRAAIESNGGTVDKFIGDAVMAVFGAPAAHEDDSVRAVRAGLAMQDEIAGFDAERKLGLKLRVGINAGEVLWGTVAGEKATAIGDAVNVAQRLESAAAPGSVLISRAVERGLRGRFRVAGRESLQVKGREEPVEVLEVIEEIAGQTERAGPSMAGLALIGRGPELADLLARASSATGCVLVIEGEAGVGKSRLAAELRREVRKRTPSAWVVTGRAHEAVRQPLGAFGDLVRQEAGVSGHDQVDADRVVAVLASQLGDGDTALAESRARLIAASLGYPTAGVRATDVDAARVVAETHFAWEKWLSRRVALVCLEDLHWADEATAALLSHLAAARPPVAIVATARPGHALPPTIERHPLRDLDAAAAGELGRAVLRAPLSEDLAQFLAEQSGGNPLYVEELARFLQDQGLVQGAPLSLTAAPGRIPDGLNGLLVARLDALPADHKTVVKAASVLGRVFWSGLLGQLAGCDAAPALAEARRRGLVFAQGSSLLPGDEQYLFRHALIREAAFGLVTKKERKRIHGLAADLLEERAQRLGRRVRGLAAVQREAAGDAAAAAALWLVSAQEALDAASAQEALIAARESLRLGAGWRARVQAAVASIALARLDEAEQDALAVIAEGTTPPEALERVHIVLLQVFEKRGDFAGMLRGAEDLLRGSLSPRNRLEARFHRASARWRLAHSAEALSDITEALTEIDHDRAWRDSPAGRRFDSRCRNLSGNIRKERGDLQAALVDYRAALELARSARYDAFAAGVLSNIGGVLSITNGTESGLTCYREAVELLRPTGDRYALAKSLINLGIALRVKGDTTSAQNVLGEALVLSREVGDRSGQAGALHNLATLLRITGTSEEAHSLFAQALALRREIGDRAGAAVTLNGLGLLSYDAGRCDDALRHLEEALEEGLALKHPALVSLCMRNIGGVQIMKGEFVLAEARFTMALEHARRHEQPEGEADSLQNLGDLAALRGDVVRAKAMLEEALGIQRGRAALAKAAEALASLAQLAADEGHGEEAEALATESIRLSQDPGCRKELPVMLANRATIRARASRPGALDDALAAVAAAVASTGAIRATVQVAVALAAHASGDISRAEAALDEAAASPGMGETPFLLALSILEARARVRAACGEVAAARQVAEEGLKRARASGAVRWVREFESHTRPQTRDEGRSQEGGI